MKKRNVFFTWAKGALIAILVSSVIVWTPPNIVDASEGTPIETPVFDQHLLLSALQEPYLKYKFMTPSTEPNYLFDGGYVVNYDANAAFLYLLLYAYYYPNQIINGYNVTEEVRKRITYLVEPGARNEPPSAGGITANWHYAAAYQAIVLAKHMPEVWESIPNDVKYRIDLMMKAQLISSNFIINPVNDPKTHATGQAGGIYSNPNHWESYNAVYQLALLYHGSIGAVNQVITTTIPDGAAYDAFLQELYENGLFNIYDQWGYQQVRDFYLGLDNTTFDERFHDEPGYVYGASHPIVDWQQIKDRGSIPLEERIITPYESWPMFRETAKFFFQHKVGEVYKDAGEPIPYSAGSTWGDPNLLEQKLTGRIVDPVARQNLPNKGETGMAYEYNTANGGRSNHNYVLEGLLPMLPTSFVLKALSSKNSELWPIQSKSDEVDEIESRIRVGMTDIIYKGTYGYFSYDFRKLVTDTTSGEWRYYDVEYDRPANLEDKAIAQQEFSVIRAYNAPRIGYDYLVGLYRAMFDNRKGYAHRAAIKLYSDFDAVVPLVNPTALKVGDVFNAVVEVDEVSQLTGMDVGIRFNPSTLAVATVDGRKRVNSLVPHMDIIMINNEVDEENGSIRFSGVSKGYTTTGTYTNKQLYKIEFVVEQEGTLDIAFDDRQFSEGLRFVDAGNRLFYPRNQQIQQIQRIQRNTRHQRP